MLFAVEEVKKKKKEVGKVELFVALHISENEEKIKIIKVAASTADEEGNLVEFEKDSGKEYPLSGKTLSTLIADILSGAKKVLQKKAQEKNKGGEKDEN